MGKVIQFRRSPVQTPTKPPVIHAVDLWLLFTFISLLQILFWWGVVTSVPLIKSPSDYLLLFPATLVAAWFITVDCVAVVAICKYFKGKT